MVIKKNKQGTFDITGVSLGKLMAIVNAIDKVGTPTAVQSDVRAAIFHNPDYLSEASKFLDKKG
jgi:hypothetical protein